MQQSHYGSLFVQWISMIPSSISLTYWCLWLHWLDMKVRSSLSLTYGYPQFKYKQSLFTDGFVNMIYLSPSLTSSVAHESNLWVYYDLHAARVIQIITIMISNLRYFVSFCKQINRHIMDVFHLKIAFGLYTTNKNQTYTASDSPIARYVHCYNSCQGNRTWCLAICSISWKHTTLTRRPQMVQMYIITVTS